jgi:hypothetical protein
MNRVNLNPQTGVPKQIQSPNATMYIATSLTVVHLATRSSTGYWRLALGHLPSKGKLYAR